MSGAGTRPAGGWVARHPRRLLAFGFGSGLAPAAPGTAGSAVGVVLWLGLAATPPAAYAAVTAALFVAGVWICGATSRELGVPDHPGIVFDEIAGVLVALAWCPREPLWVAAGFAIFRLLDACKPWPIGLADRRVHGGFGIMLDDLLAALLTAAALAAAQWAIG